MALPAFINATAVTPGGTGTACTTSALATITGSFLFVGSTHYTSGVNISAVVDTVGNTFARAGTVQGGDANQDNEIWYTPNPIVGTTSNAVIVRYTGTAAFRNVSQCQFSWGGATGVTYMAEAAHTLDAGIAYSSGAVSVTLEALVIGNWVSYDATRALSSSTGTICIATPLTASVDMATGFRLLTADTTTILTLAGGDVGARFSIIAKSFFALTAGTTTPAVAASITLPLTGAGQG